MQYRIHREGDAQNTPSSASTPVNNWERNTLREVLPTEIVFEWRIAY